MDAIDAALGEAKKADQPSMIACKTTIGYGAPNKQGTSATHGAPLGDAEIDAARAYLNWDAAPFELPDDVLANWRAVGAKGAALTAGWDKTFAALDSGVQADFRRRPCG